MIGTYWKNHSVPWSTFNTIVMLAFNISYIVEDWYNGYVFYQHNTNLKLHMRTEVIYLRYVKENETVSPGNKQG